MAGVIEHLGIMPFVLVAAGLALVAMKVLVFRAPRREKVAAATEDSGAGAAYSARAGLLSPAEIRAFRMLHRALRGRAYLCPKVRVADLLEVDGPGHRGARERAVSRISGAHVDFAVIDARGRVLFVVQADEASPDAADCGTRDDILERCFALAGVPLLRLDPENGGSVEACAARIGTLLAGVPARRGGSRAAA